MKAAWPPTVLLLLLSTSIAPAADNSSNLSFAADGRQFTFNTGQYRGVLHAQGKALGLTSVVDLKSGSEISGATGLFSHYRLLDSNSRYGTGAWDWPSQARLLADGGVEVTWTADAQHPLDMTATYRWKSADTLDLVTQVTAHQALPKFEVFLASYFKGFSESLVYTKALAGRDAPQFLPATRPAGIWQAFPRDDAAAAIINDGRWKRPPNPVDWQIMPQLQFPLAIRRDNQSGLTAVIMSRPEDCFAVLTPFGEESHRSVYLSLLGRDLKANESGTVRARLVIGHDISDEQAVGLYKAYLAESR